MASSGLPCRNVGVILWYDEVCAAAERLGFVDTEGSPNAQGLLVGFLSGLNVPVALSPLHDKDMYTADDVRKWVDKRIDPDSGYFISEDLEKVRTEAPKVGEVKKWHWHLMLKFKGNKTAANLVELFAPILEIKAFRWRKIEHPDSYLRYLAHMDNEDKHHYPTFDVLLFGGMDGAPLLKRNEAANISKLCEINRVIKKKKFRYFHQLDNWAYETGDMDTIAMVTGRASYFASVFRSKNDERAFKAAEKKNSEKAMS